MWPDICSQSWIIFFMTHCLVAIAQPLLLCLQASMAKDHLSAGQFFSTNQGRKKGTRAVEAPFKTPRELIYI